MKHLYLILMAMILCNVVSAQNKITLVPASQTLLLSEKGGEKVKIESVSLIFLVNGAWPGKPIVKKIQIQSFNPITSPLFFETASNGNIEAEIMFNKEDFDSAGKSKNVVKQILCESGNI